MKFDSGKVWPHPVLRPFSCGDDYPHSEFEVEIEVDRVEGGLAVNMQAVFELSDKCLLMLVKKGLAKYVLLIRSSKTHYREIIESSEPKIQIEYSAGDLSGKVELSAFLIASDNVSPFQSKSWHEDFDGLTFDIKVGSVLAEDIPKEYWIDTVEESPVGSIFEHRMIDYYLDGGWQLDLEGDRVGILMSLNDSERYKMARKIANSQAEAQYLLNGLYLPALLSVLLETDKNTEMYQDYRWFSSLNNRLETVGCAHLGSETADRLLDAQKTLDYPFTKMPLMAQIEE